MEPLAQGFVRDPDHWLLKLSPGEWLAAAQNELARARQAYAQHNARAGIAGCKRAAGMALNALLVVRPDAAWGRSYVEHVAAVTEAADAPDAVREACRVVLTAKPKAHDVVLLHTPKGDLKVVDAARDVLAHVYARLVQLGVDPGVRADAGASGDADAAPEGDAT